MGNSVAQHKKTIIPPRTRTQRYHRSTKQHIILARPKLKWSSIQWLLLRHHFLTAHIILYPQPTNPQSYHQTNEPALDLPWLHDISLEIDDALTAFHTADRHLNNCIPTLHHAEDDCSIYSIEQLHSTTSTLWTEISAVTGPPAQLMPDLTPKCAMPQCHPPFTQEKAKIIEASPILKQMMPQSPTLMSVSILQVDPLISSTSPQPLQLICTRPQAAPMAVTRA